MWHLKLPNMLHLRFLESVDNWGNLASVRFLHCKFWKKDQSVCVSDKRHGRMWRSSVIAQLDPQRKHGVWKTSNSGTTRAICFRDIELPI